MVAAAVSLLAPAPALARRSGMTWGIQPAPSPQPDAVFFSVSCHSDKQCMAVGIRSTQDGHWVPLAEVSDRDRWTVASPRAAQLTDGSFRAVSCPAKSKCLAVGERGGVPVAGHWDHGSWTMRELSRPTGDGFVQLEDVACSAPNACTAVGWTQTADGQRSLAERWDGRTWRLQPTANPAGAQLTTLSGTSCVDDRFCMGVGQTSVPTYAGTGTGGLAQHWNGGSWTAQAIPMPDGNTVFMWPMAVSCLTNRFCVTVGMYTDVQGHDRILAASWDGQHWTVQDPPNPPDRSSRDSRSQLYDVSCTSMMSCVGSGRYYDTAGHERALIEMWDGTSWTIQTTPAQPHPESTLWGISCQKKGCTAVGETRTDGDDARRFTLVERSS